MHDILLWSLTGALLMMTAYASFQHSRRYDPLRQGARYLSHEMVTVTEPMRPDPAYKSGSIMLPEKHVEYGAFIAIRHGKRVECWHLMRHKSHPYEKEKNEWVAHRETDGEKASPEFTERLVNMLKAAEARVVQTEQLSS